MGKDNNVLKTLDSLSVSRRSFMKGLAAIGALGAVAGCSNSDDNSVIQTGGGSSGEGNLSGSDFANPKIFYAGCVHNCGTGVRCVSKIHVVNGRIVRVTSDESDTAYDGSYRNKEQYNDSRALTCPKGRSYKYRVHHPGRLQYVLKQTKARGDVTGFIRISPEQAMKEIAQKYRAIYSKYGAGAIYNTYGTSASYGGTFSNPSAARSALTSVGSTRSAFSDYSYHQYNYANPLTGHPDIGGPYSKSNNIGANFHAMAGGAIKNLVSWGSNVLSTNNSVSYGYIRAVEYLKNNGKAYFIGPEFTDTGVVCHTEWVKLRNYTDAALIMAMLYHMLTNTFDLTNGELKSSPMLDIDYLDTCVYGFFASPEYWIKYDNVYTNRDIRTNEYIKQDAGYGSIYTTRPSELDNWNTGTKCWIKTASSEKKETDASDYADPDPDNKVGAVVFTKPSEEPYNDDNDKVIDFYREDIQYYNASRGEYAYTTLPIKKINAVPAGESLADYILGSDAAKLQNITYADTGSTYTAQQFGTNKRFGTGCTYPKGKNNSGTSEYQYKNDFNTPKTPEWASKITGVPVDKIIELAELYANPDNNVLTEWCGGFQKQENGVMNVFALSALLVVCKTFGKWGGGMYGPWASTIINPDGDDISGTAGDTEFLSLRDVTNGSAGISSTSQPTASVSCTQWFNGIKLAFKDQLQAGRYTGEYIPDWDFTNGPRYSNDDAGVKAGVVWKRYTADDPNGTYKKGDIMTYQENGVEYYDFEGRDESGSGNHTPVFAGTRMIISAAGGIPFNQHSNTNDTAAMYRALPISGTSTDPDTFCLVTFDIYMSPTARFADYVIPCTVALEAADKMSIGGETIYRPAIIEPKGDAKSGWEWAYLAYKAQAELGDFEGATINPHAHLDYVKSTNGMYRDIQNIADEVLDAAIVNPSSRFYGMTKDEVYARQYVPRANTEETKTQDPYKTDNSGKIRKNLESYLASDNRGTQPFIYTTFGDNATNNSFGAEVYSSVRASESTVAGGLTGRTDGNDRPNFSGKMHVYNEAAVWDYEHRLSKYHGWLLADQRGQSNKDKEGNMIVYPIPMYIAFEDCFKEAYDGFSGGKNESFFQSTGKNKPLTMSTTHDRFRVHSTHAENPLMRELNHRVVGGGWASGNDWNEYVVMPQGGVDVDSSVPVTPMLSSAIYNKKKETASWHEIWISTEDAAERGISDGDLCLVENPIGKVRVIARVSNRIMKGHLNLHQGSWYDPNPADGVDDGGCANTLISSHPSRYDRGNAQQFAYVKISKTSYDLR